MGRIKSRHYHFLDHRSLSIPFPIHNSKRIIPEMSMHGETKREGFMGVLVASLFCSSMWLCRPNESWHVNQEEAITLAWHVFFQNGLILKSLHSIDMRPKAQCQ
jgi:hypothetical protein